MQSACILCVYTYNVVHAFIGQSTDRCSGGSIKSVTPPGNSMCNSPTDSTNSHQKAVVISSIVVFILLVIITILVVIIVLQQRRWKKQKQALNNIIDGTYSNSAYNGELSQYISYSRMVGSYKKSF